MTRPSALSIADLDTLIAALDGDDGLARVRAIAHLSVDGMPIQLARDLHAALRHSATVRAAAIAECVAEIRRVWRGRSVAEGDVMARNSHVQNVLGPGYSDSIRILSALSPHSPDAKAALVERCARAMVDLDTLGTIDRKYWLERATAVLEELGI